MAVISTIFRFLFCRAWVFFVLNILSITSYGNDFQSYFGKKFQLGYSVGVSSIGEDYWGSLSFFSIGKIITHRIEGEFMVSKRFSAFINFDYFNLTTPTKRAKFDIPFGKYDNFEFLPSPDYETILNRGLAFSVGTKIFYSSKPSPFGKYLKLGACLMRYGMKNWNDGIAGDYYGYYVNQYGQSTFDLGQVVLKANHNVSFDFFLVTGFGIQQALTRRLIMDFNLDCSFMINGSYSDFNYNDKGFESVDDYYFYYLNRYVKHSKFFQLNLSFKYML